MAAAINKWRTPEDVHSLAATAEGRIGPNAILQMLPPLDQVVGQDRRADLLQRAGIYALPDGTSMVPEVGAARLHQQVRRSEPDRAPEILTQAGRQTADYILAHRIPKAAQTLLKALPARPAAWLLAKAIDKHAWTFVGSGAFRAVSPWAFEIDNNPLIEGEASDTCLCHWHAAVFARLYQVLVSPDCRCEEIECGAVGNGERCRFVITRS